MGLVRTWEVWGLIPGWPSIPLEFITWWRMLVWLALLAMDDHQRKIATQECSRAHGEAESTLIEKGGCHRVFYHYQYLLAPDWWVDPLALLSNRSCQNMRGLFFHSRLTLNSFAIYNMVENAGRIGCVGYGWSSMDEKEK